MFIQEFALLYVCAVLSALWFLLFYPVKGQRKP